ALVRIEKRVNHRQSVAEDVGERDSQHLPGPAPVNATVGTAPAVFDQARLDVAVFDHHGVIEHRDVGHAAVAVARVEIGTEYRILFGGRGGRTHIADHVGIALGDPAHVARWSKIGCYHAHRDAGAATFAGRAIGYRLASAETAMRQQIVEFARTLADQVSKYLALFLPFEIRAGRRSGQIELWCVARMLGHRSGHPSVIPLALASRGECTSSKPFIPLSRSHA